MEEVWQTIKSETTDDGSKVKHMETSIMGNNMMLIWILLSLEEYLSIINVLISIYFVLILGALYQGKTDKEYMGRFVLQSLAIPSSNG